MKLWQTHLVRLCLLLLVAVPAYSQRGTLGLDFGETSDKFGGLPRSTGVLGMVDGEIIVLQTKDKEHGANVIAGGELRFPVDTLNHATEFAGYVGSSFIFTKNFSAGFHVQYHRIDLPPSTSNDQTFNRSKMVLVELPGFLQYKFLSSRRAFLRVEGGPEFSPRFHPLPTSLIPDPNLDHGYFVRGVVGYNFGSWYAKGTYETRYFKFKNDVGNPNDLYNWRSDFITGGVGITF